jgi:hypothetical protein
MVNSSLTLKRLREVGSLYLILLMSPKSVYFFSKPDDAYLLCSPPIEEVTLAKYASDLIEGLVQYSKNPTGDGVSFLRFLWLRCHRKIRNRLQADQLMLGKRLPELLADWNPEENDDVEDHWFHVDPRTHSTLDKHSIPFRLREDKTNREYLCLHLADRTGTDGREGGDRPAGVPAIPGVAGLIRVK